MRRIKGVFVLLLATAGILAVGMTAYASEVKTRVITSEPFTDDEKNHRPDEKYEADGVEYELVDFEVIEVPGEKREEEVSDTIFYDAISVTDSIPGNAEITVHDPLMEDDIAVSVPLISTERSNERWEDSFEFEITVHDYDAAAFMLGDKEVKLSLDTPLSGYEEDLLNIIGVDSAAYRISSITWNGEPYDAGDGTRNRNLLAKGDMLIVDVAARYGGMVELPAVDAKKVRATYEMKIAETSAAEESEAASSSPQTQEDTGFRTEEDNSAFGRLRAKWFDSEARRNLLNSGLGRIIVGAIDWILDTPGHLTVSLGSLAILLFGAAFFFVTTVRKKKKTS